MLLTPAEMRATEDAAFAAGATAADLMERAGLGIAGAVQQFLPRPGTVLAFVAKGHNGGDALVAARHLHAAGWHVVLRFVGDPAGLRPLTRQQLDALPATFPTIAPGETTLPGHVPGTPVAIFDGILGIGATGKTLQGDYRLATAHLNRLRHDLGATTFAIDIPTGLDGATGHASPDTVRADVTVTVAQAKTGLVADPATPHVGRLVVVPLAELDHPATAASDDVVLTPRTLARHLPRLAVDAHKGTAGRVSVVAGSPGFTGAAALTAAGALHAGAGLVTVFTTPDAAPAVASPAPPEVMVKAVADLRAALDHPADALAVGPGLGTTHGDALTDLLAGAAVPLVLDADGLNTLAAGDVSAGLASRPAPTLLTPHPGEMHRLLGGEEMADRRTAATAFAAAHPGTTLLLKGARTVIATADHPAAFNTTGTPGMASGGMGDTLTGIAAALAARSGHGHLHHAACLAAWLHGRAAEAAIASGAHAPESLTATAVAHHLGPAFDALRRHGF